MVYQIKKFLSNKLSILNEDFNIQKSRKGFYYLKMTDQKVGKPLNLKDNLGTGSVYITNSLIKTLFKYLYLLFIIFYRKCYYQIFKR